MAKPGPAARRENDRKIFDIWYPRNWQSDRGVRRSSGGARGLWIEMINLMIQSPERGVLLDSNIQPVRAYTVENLSKDVELPVDEVRKWLAELLENRVYSVDRRGRIFCRRMVAAQRWHEISKENGKLGGNPALINQGDSSKGLTQGLSPRPTLNKHKTIYRKKERGDEDGPSLFGSQASRGAKTKGVPWSLDRKRAFAHERVAKALGAEGWEIVMAAVDGNSQALKVCKAKAKEIGVTWYSGKPDITLRAE